MGKVICDICGTAYPETASKCPICGSSREYALENPEEDFSMDEQDFSAPPKKNRSIFDFDEVNSAPSAVRAVETDEYDDEELEEEEPSQTNVGLVVVLVVLIVLLLLATGFFFVRYMLPNMTEKAPAPVQTVATQPMVTEPEETTEATIPCTNLMMDGGKMELGKDGKKLLNVRAYPEDTTDILTYSSGDEAVVTISEGGTVTAVGEGQTVITITCGSQTIKCNVTVDYSISEETVPSGEIPAMKAGEDEAQTDATVETKAEVNSTEETKAQETTAEEETKATESTEETQETTASSTTLQLKKTDITIMNPGVSVNLELEGDIKPEDVTWFTMDSSVAIVHNGLVTSLGRGITRIYAEYKGQQVYCIVRCN